MAGGKFSRPHYTDVVSDLQYYTRGGHNFGSTFGLETSITLSDGIIFASDNSY